MGLDGEGRERKRRKRRGREERGYSPQTSIPGADCNGLGLDYITLQQTAETLCSCWSYSEVSSFSTLSSFGVKTACEIIATLLVYDLTRAGTRTEMSFLGCGLRCKERTSSFIALAFNLLFCQSELNSR